MAIRTTTLETMLADSAATPRFRTLLVPVYAAIALLLSQSGVYVECHTWPRRTSEMGVRVALRVSLAGIAVLILHRAATLSAARLIAGLAIASFGSKVLDSMLFGLTLTGALTHGAAAVVLARVTLLATALPAYRAAKLDPAKALREA